ncbi:MAG TPA: zf-TFIIB domain-containing protein [Acidimicrobiia bacterium]|nr:zf-TFIIB domain-containing protein [Acidimicrobiia bacterium]
MKCPVDGTTLLLTERQSVELDYCPECRGVWLDRGELDKLVRRDDDGEDGDDEHRRLRVVDDGGERQGKKKRKGWLSEIFEFGE